MEGHMPDLNALIAENPHLPEPDAYGDEFSPSTQQSYESRGSSNAVLYPNYNPSDSQVHVVTNISSYIDQRNNLYHQNYVSGNVMKGTENHFSETSLEVQPSVGSNRTQGFSEIKNSSNLSFFTNETVNNVSESVHSMERNSQFQPNLNFYTKKLSEEEFKWEVLKTLDENLVERDIMMLKFLCLDIIPGGQLEEIRRGFELFDILEKKLYISRTNFIILAELMFRIGRIDMLKLLVIDHFKYQGLIEGLSSSISDYRVLLHEIAEDTVHDELKLMKFYVDDHFKKAKLDAVDEPQELFILMEKKQLLGPKNLNLLMKMMQQVGKVQMVQKIKIFRGDIYPGNPVPFDQWDGRYTRPTKVDLPHMNIDRGSTTNTNVYGNNQNNMHNRPQQRSVPVASFQGTITNVENSYKTNMKNMGYNIGSQRMQALYDINQLNVDQSHSVKSEEHHCGFSEYKMDARPRGYCLIINNKLFDKHPDKTRELKPREGSDIDKDNLESIFTELNFIVKIYEDLTAQDMVGVVNQYAYKVDHSHFDCFVCCILTHGRKDKLFGSDGILVDILEFTNCFKGIKCNTLRGKPKLFFIQACQGKHKQRGYTVAKAKDLEIDTDDNSVTTESGESIPNEADFLISLATVPGFVSYRSKTHGSWFVNALVEALRKYHAKEDLMSILITVNNEVSAMVAPMEDDEYKQVPAPQVTLRKKIYFR